MAEATEASSSGEARQFLTFQLDERLYALPASDVAEVIRMPSFVRVPQAPTALLGLANLRGEVMPVASLRGLMGEAVDVAASSRAIVLNGGAAIALAVDRVEALVTRAEGAIGAYAAAGGERLCGAFETEKGVAKVLDLAGLLASAFVARPLGRHAAAAASPRTIDATSAVESGRRLVSFEVAGQEFAVPLDAVREIIAAPANLAASPGTDEVVLGVAAHRGGLLPLMSLRGLLGFERTEIDARTSVVVTQVAGVLVGLVADRMRAVLLADERLVEPIPAVLAARVGGEAKVAAIYRGENGRRLVSIIEPEQLFREDIMQRLGSGDGSGTEAPAASGAAQRLFLVFRLEGDEFALPIDAVDEIAAAPTQITRLPKMPSFLEGVVNLRGEVLPVVDQRRRFGMAANEAGGRRLVVVRAGGRRAGLIVDSVTEVLRTGADAVHAPPDFTDGANRLVAGVINLESAGRIVVTLDPAELLSRVERGLLEVFESDQVGARSGQAGS